MLMALGAVLLVGAATGFVIVPEHKPQFSCGGWGGPCGGWSRPAYDAARIGTWALLIVGALLVVIGIINFARGPHRGGTRGDTVPLPTARGEGAR
jgi:hypothetical protein